MSALYSAVRERYGKPAKFVAQLKLRMQAHEITQSQLAKRVGYHASHVSGWLRGRVIPSMATMMNLDEACDQLIDDKQVTA